MSTNEETRCPSCGRPTYRALNERFGPTGSMHTEVVYRHEDTGWISCTAGRYATTDATT